MKIKIQIITILIVLALSFKSKAQTWSNYTSGVYSNHVTPAIGKMVMDSLNNIYAVGPNDSNQCEYVVKWNGSTWQKLGNICNNYLGDGINDIDIDYNGDLYVSSHLYINNNYENNILKWNGTSWQKVGDLSSIISDNGQNVMTIECVGATEIYCAGFFKNANNKCFVAKWNGTIWSELGNITANNAIQKIIKTGSDEQGNSILLATGGFTNSNGKAYVAQFSNQAWSPLETTTSKLSNHSYNLAMVANNRGDVYVSGWNDTNSYDQVSHWNGSQWQVLPKPINMGYGYWQRSLALDNNGNLYIGGGTYDSILFTESCVLRYVNNAWIEIGGYKSFYEEDAVFTITFDKNNCLYAAGWFTNNNYQNFVKQICNLATKLEELPTAKNIQIFPNPTNNYFTFQTYNENSFYTVNMYNASGQLVKKLQTKNNVPIRVNDLPKSLYFVEIKNTNEHYTQKLLIE
jgi:hypothetical protein